LCHAGRANKCRKWWEAWYTREDDLHERSNGDAGSRVGPRLVNSLAVELPSHLPPGAPRRSDELRGAPEVSEFRVELHSQRQSVGEHVCASDPGYGARLHGTLQYAGIRTADATTTPTMKNLAAGPSSLLHSSSCGFLGFKVYVHFDSFEFFVGAQFLLQVCYIKKAMVWYPRKRSVSVSVSAES
jgi:hypothetical protein